MGMQCTMPGHRAGRRSSAKHHSARARPASRPPAPLIVIGFMGGHVRAGNLVHREALLVRDLERRYPTAVRAMTFANRDEAAALHSVLSLLDTDNSGALSDNEKTAPASSSSAIVGELQKR